jgi:hypothetical protein
MKVHERSTIHFQDYPSFQPNVTPQEMFQLGIFGGAYFRPIHSTVTGKDYQRCHEDCVVLTGIAADLPCRADFTASINKYGVAAGSSLQEWESSGWINAQDPYGWVQWYCHFYAGRRTPDDVRQIDRWNKFAGPTSGRFRTQLINKIKNAGGIVDNYKISPVVRQGLLQWGYELTQADYTAKPA